MPVEEKWSPRSRQEKAQFAREAAVNRGDVSQETWDVWQGLNNGQAVNPENLTQSGKDYYSQLEAATEKQQPVYQAPSYVQTASGAKREVQQPQDEQERKSVVVNNDNILSPKERLEQREKSYFDQVDEQPKLRPQVITDDIDAIMKQYDEWQENREERGLDPERERRFTDMDTGEDLTNPLDWNILGFTSQQKTPTAVKNIYDYYFAQEDANPITPHDHDRWDERRGTWGRDLDVMPNYIRNMPVYVEGMNGPEVMNFGDSQALNDWWSRPVVDENAIDNGLSPESRESIYMTGRRYLDYVTKYGLPGRDPNEINPDAIYSKQDEMENYGFIPYLTDEGIGKFHDDAAAGFVNNVFNNFANLRRDNTSYSFNYDGNTYDAKDFTNKYATWVGRALNSNEKTFTDASKVTEDSVPLTWVLHDAVTGEDVYAPSASGEATTDPETGLPMIDFHTGDPNDNWYFDDADDMNNSVRYEFAGNDNPALGWKNIEPLTLTDGTKIRADKAMDLYDHQDQYADYGKLDWGKPNVSNPLEEGGWAPWFVDMALGSAPLFWAPTAATQAIGNTYQNMQGFRAGKQDDNGTYKLLSEDPTREQQLVTSAGSALLPATERLWGIGRSAASSAMPFMKTLERTHPNIANHPLTVLSGNALGEGVEEIPGNLVEEMQSSGTIGDYFANPLYYYIDDSRNKVYTTEESDPDNPNVNYYAAYDRQGKRLKDQSTDFFGRQGNFWEEAPVSMLGGAALGGVLGTGEAIGAIGPYRESRAERDKFGYNIEVPEEVLNYTRRQAGE